MATTTTAATTAGDAARRRVVLHFDLNRTVLMSDAAGGRTMENTVDYLLSECTWGYVHPHKPSEWVCVSEASSIEPPSGGVASVTLDGAAVTLPLITYKQFVDDAHPYKSLETDAGADGGIEQVKAFNKAAKKKRTALQSAFTGGDGPGSRVRASFDEVMAKLHFPEGAQRDAAKAAAQTLPPSRLQEAWSEGKYYLLPSFVRLLTALGDAPLDFKLVFRTFGDDIPEVARELELLAAGAHPLAPTDARAREALRAFQLDASPGSAAVGTFYRDGFGADGTALALGSLLKAPLAREPGALDAFYAPSGARVARGFGAVERAVGEMLRGRRVAALRDYWEWWSAHAEHGEFGKLLLVRREGDERDVQVFFDDHIEAEHAHIVDVRDAATGAPVPFAESKGRYLQRVEPFAAITDDMYFVKLVDALVRRIDGEGEDDGSKL